MPAPVEPAHVELGQLRELLAVDRRSAGEARRAQRSQPLTTASYSMPWHVQAKRRWRSDRQLRIKAWGACLATTAALVLWQLPLFGSQRALTGEPHVSRAAETKIAARSERREQTSRAALVASQDTHEPTTLGQPATAPLELSPRRRLQQADLWLRVGTERGAREARSLLESALTELPRNAHGQAALAKACLLLHDQGCARGAVDMAMQGRPWRAGYRVLSRQIDAAFLRTEQ